MGVATISLSILTAAAVYDVHRTLQFVGTYGLLATFGTAPVRYSSKEVGAPLQAQSLSF